MGARAVTVQLKENFDYDLASILSAVTDRTKIVYLCSPNNPTGTILSKIVLKQLLDALPKRVLVMLDAAYSHFVSVEDYSDGMEFVRAGYPLLVLKTFSKIYGLAGIRVGFGAASEQIIQNILQVKEPFNVNALAQAAAAAAIDDIDHISRSQALVKEERERLYEAFRQLSIEYTVSMSNFVLVKLGERAEAIYEQLMARGIIVRHAGIWSLPAYIRISIGTAEENDILVSVLKELL